MRKAKEIKELDGMEVSFTVDDYLFTARHSHINPDQSVWYLYAYNRNGDDELGVVNNPFENYEIFYAECKDLAKNYLK